MTKEDAVKKVNELTAADTELKELLGNLKTPNENLARLLSEYEKIASDAPQKDFIARLTSQHEAIDQLLGNRKPVSEQALIAEYNSLSTFLNARRTQQSTVNGFLVTGAGLALTFAVGTMASQGIRGLVSLIAVLLVSVAWISWRGLRVLDDETYRRIHKIEEEELNVQGHRNIMKIIEGKFWPKTFHWARKWVWDVFYGILFFASLFTSVYLFLPVIHLP